MSFSIWVYQTLDQALDQASQPVNPDHPGVKVGQVRHREQLPDWLAVMGLAEHQRTLVVVGGASGLDADQQVHLESLFQAVLAPLAEEMQLCVVDGGTDAGVMQLMGQARTVIGGTFPLIGVAPRSLVNLPDQPATNPDGCALEPNHTHCLLVPGEKWGDESVWIADIATLIAGPKTSLTILINGGAVTLQDAYASLQAGREIVIMAGTGRVADDIAQALECQDSPEAAAESPPADPRITALLDHPADLLTAIEVSQHPAQFKQDLKQHLLD